MPNKATLCLLAAAAAALPIESPAPASDTVTYSYDPLGRLVAVSTSGGPNNGQAVSTRYDPAGNRCRHGVGGGGAGGGACVGSGGGGGSGNQPPVAVADTGSMSRCAPQSFAVLGNDSDPDGHLPLALVSVSGGEGQGTPSIQGTSILFTPEGSIGPATVDYVMRDALGATAAATLEITITIGDCGGEPPEVIGAAGGGR